MQHTKQIALISCVTCLLGVLLYAWLHDWIIIAPLFPCEHDPMIHHPVATQRVTIFVPRSYNHDDEQETRLIFAYNDMQNYTSSLVQEWLSLLHECQFVSTEVALQAVFIDPAADMLYISFDRSFTDNNAAAYTKWRIYESLLRSLRENGVNTALVQFLMNHQPLCDEHIDITYPWPVTGYIRHCDTIHPPLYRYTQKKEHRRIILIPGGSLNSASRYIEATCEQHITQQCCQRIKDTVERLYPELSVHIVSSHANTHKEIARDVNRIQPDVCISVHAYHARDHEPRCHMYHRRYAHDIQSTAIAHDALELIPYTNVHRMSLARTTWFGHAYAHALEKRIGAYMAIGPILGFPFCPLSCFACPAIALELGVKYASDGEAYSIQLAHALYDALTRYQTTL